MNRSDYRMDRLWSGVTAAVFLMSEMFTPVATHAAPFAYVANYGDGTVSVIDTANNAPVATVPVPNAFNLAVNPAGTRLYVGGLGLWVIDTTTNGLVGKVTATESAGPMAFSPGGDRLYVLGLGPGGLNGPGQVTVLDTTTNTVIAEIPVGLLPAGIVVSPDGARVYVANTFDDSEGAGCRNPPPFDANCVLTVSVIDTGSNTLVCCIPVGPGIHSLAINRAGTRVYVGSDRDISVIDTSFDAVVARIPGGVGDLAVDPSGAWVYATNSPNVVVIDAATNSVATRIPVGALLVALALTPDGSRAYVTNGYPDSIDVVDVISHTVVDTLPAGAGGVDIVIGPENPPITAPPVPTETPTPTPAASQCAGDCNGNGSVTIDEIMHLVNIALGAAQLSDCSAGDADHDGRITVNEIIAAVNAALDGCGVLATPTP